MDFPLVAPSGTTSSKRFYYVFLCCFSISHDPVWFGFVCVYLVWFSIRLENRVAVYFYQPRRHVRYMGQ